MGTTANYALHYPEETTAPPDVAADVHTLASDVDSALAGVAATIKPLDTAGTNITNSAPGDTRLAGTSGKAADAGHRHAREASNRVGGATRAGSLASSTFPSGTQTFIPNLSDIPFTAIAGHRYKVTVTVNMLFSSGTNVPISVKVYDGGGSAPTTASTEVFEMQATSPGSVAGIFNVTGHVELTGLSAGAHRLGLVLLPSGSSMALGNGSTTSPIISSVSIEDMG